jgi:hypothetical protein
LVRKQYRSLCRPAQQGQAHRLDAIQGAARVIEIIEKERPDAIVIDGDGIGAGVIDQLRFRGFGDKLFEFHGSRWAHDPKMYFNRRSEVLGIDARCAQRGDGNSR